MVSHHNRARECCWWWSWHYTSRSTRGGGVCGALQRNDSLKSYVPHGVFGGSEKCYHHVACVSLSLPIFFSFPVLCVVGIRRARWAEAATRGRRFSAESIHHRLCSDSSSNFRRNLIMCDRQNARAHTSHPLLSPSPSAGQAKAKATDREIKTKAINATHHADKDKSNRKSSERLPTASLSLSLSLLVPHFSWLR